KYGYRNFYVQGTSGRFSGTDVFLKSHGFDRFYDMSHLVSRFEGDRAKETLEAKVRARFYDEFTYDFFKEKISALPADKPFFAVMMTIDTHFGNTTPNSQKLFPTETANTIHHASYMASQFLEWVKKQPFGRDTTVVFIGDHLMMKVGGRKNPGSRTFFKNVPLNSRFIFNVFVNARKKAPDRVRHFTQVDIFPTLVESLGYEIKGSRLGLGTSLFSGEKTLLEELGEEELNRQLRKKNLLYDSLWEPVRH
ncbi:MAG: sulfatase-like hydrolase/transferase, partial [Oxalobacter sp.]|nr:sulfatase-like hydrolase/transferase [Oxalobacter sp.]